MLLCSLLRPKTLPPWAFTPGAVCADWPSEDGAADADESDDNIDDDSGNSRVEHCAAPPGAGCGLAAGCPEVEMEEALVKVFVRLPSGSTLPMGGPWLSP